MTTAKLKAIEEIIGLQRQLVSAIRHPAPGPLMDIEITIGQLKSLYFIDFKESTNARTLAEGLGVTPPCVTGIIDRLVEQGLVSREENPENRRMQTLKVTGKGKALIIKMRESQSNLISGLLVHLNEEELMGLTRGLKALLRAAEAHQQENMKKTL